MYFNPPTPGNNSANPFWHPLNQRTNPQPVQEAVTVDIEFKNDAAGAAAVGTETGRRGLVVSGKKVRDKVYKMTFTNNATMNKFMDKYEDKLNESTEQVDESTPAYRKMMKDYEGSDMKKVFDILKPKGFRVGEQDDTLVRNMLKKHKNDVKKAAAEIEKKYSNRFESVELDEAIDMDTLITFAEEFGSQPGKAKESAIKRGREHDKDGDHVIVAGTMGAGKPAYASSIDRVHGDILTVVGDMSKAVKVNKKTADMVTKGKKNVKAEKVD